MGLSMSMSGRSNVLRSLHHTHHIVVVHTPHIRRKCRRCQHDNKECFVIQHEHHYFLGVVVIVFDLICFFFVVISILI